MIDTGAIRDKVLYLALSGQLTSKESQDESVDELMKKIAVEKDCLLKERKGRADKNIKDEIGDTPFEIPEHWGWGKVGLLGLFKKGPFGSALTKSMFVPKGSNTVKVYEQQHAIQKNHTLGKYYITREYFEESMQGFEVFSGDIIVSCAGTIGETYVLPDGIEQGIINQALMKVSLVPSIDKKYFLMYFDFVLKKTAQSESNGMAIKNIPPFDILKNWEFPLTSLAEQQRIVERVESIFSLLDEIDEAQKQYADNLASLKSKLLKMALSGNISCRMLSDDNVKDLLDRARTKTNSKKRLAIEDTPFEIPTEWEWCTIADITVPIGSQLGQIQSKDVKPCGKYPAISQGKIYIDGYCDDKEKVVNTLPVLLFGDHTKVVKYINMPFVICADGTKCMNVVEANPKYIFYWMKYASSQLDDRGYARHFSLLKKYPLPLPSLAEQNRIVEKLEEILPLCN